MKVTTADLPHKKLGMCMQNADGPPETTHLSAMLYSLQQVFTLNRSGASHC